MDADAPGGDGGDDDDNAPPPSPLNVLWLYISGSAESRVLLKVALKQFTVFYCYSNSNHSLSQSASLSVCLS